MAVPCAKCGKLHDVSALEPSLKRPDAYLAVPDTERSERTTASNDFCVVRGSDGASQRWFVRVLIPVPVLGVEEPCCWGVWCEVTAQDYARISLLWDDPDQCSHPPFAVTLANDLDGYPPTAGLAGKIRFRDPKRIPYFEFASGVEHPLVDEVRSGVTPARVLEWLAPLFHEGAG